MPVDKEKFDDDVADRFRPHLGKAEWAVLQNIFSLGRSGKHFRRYLKGDSPYMPNAVRNHIKRCVLDIRKSGTVSSDIKAQLNLLCSTKTLKELKLYEIVKSETCRAVCDNSGTTLVAGANARELQVPLSIPGDNDFVPRSDAAPARDCDATTSSAAGEASPSNDLQQGSDELLPREKLAGPSRRTSNLSSFAEDFKGKLTHLEVINHVASKHNVKHAAVTELLTMFNVLQPKVDYNDKTPMTAGTLMKVAPDLYAKVDTFKGGDDDNKSTDGSDESDDDSDDEPSVSDFRLKRIRKNKEYARFGVENVLMKHSPGLIYAKEHVNAIYAAACLNDKFVSQNLMDYLDPVGAAKRQLYDVRGIPGEAQDDRRCPPKGMRRLYTIKTHDVETCFWVDLHIDGVAMFKNTLNGSATPIQMRLFGLGTSADEEPLHIIPTTLSKPSVIGFYYGGTEALDLDFLLRFIIFEFRRLHPKNKPDNPDYLIDPETGTVLDTRKCSAVVRCICADQKCRCEVRHVKQGGYFSCERCWARGVKLSEKDCVRLLESDCKEKTDQEWDLFLTKYWDTETNQYKDCVKKDEAFRKPGMSPFGEKPRIIPPLTGVALDGMHILGGGAGKRLLEVLFRTYKPGKHGSRALNNLAKAALKKANMYLSEWKKPKEFNREVRPIEEIVHWKMREAHDAVLYHLVALLGDSEIREGVGEKESDVAMLLVIALHLIYHNTHEMPSDFDIDEADCLLHTFFENFKKCWKDTCVTPKIHDLLHLAQECRLQKAHLGSYDAYIYENWLGEISRDLVRTGKNIVKQFVGNVTNNAANQLPLDKYGRATSRQVDFDAVVDEMLQLGSMDLPPTTIESVDYNIRKQTVKCSGFDCSIRYPDNVLVIRDEDRTDPGYRGNTLVHILIVTGFREGEDGTLLVRGRMFKSPREAHFDCKNKIRYLALNLLGMHEGYKYELSDVECEFDFQDVVIGKCFPFHMVLTHTNGSGQNPVSEACSPSQWWIFVREMHTCNPQTLSKPNTGRRRK